MPPLEDAADKKNVLKLVNVGVDRKPPVPDGYELAEPLVLESGEYFMMFFSMPTGEPRVAFYTVRWQSEKNGWSTRTHGSQVAQAKLRRIM